MSKIMNILRSFLEKSMPKTMIVSTLRDYADVATVHGISYIFSRSLPSIDRFLWTFFTAAW